MDKNNIDEVAKAIASLKAWKNASKYNWALVSEMFEKPLIACVNIPENGPIAARLMLFNGFAAHRDFMIFTQNQDVSFALSPIDFDHYEVVALKDGKVEVLDYRPGYAPVHPDEETCSILAPVLYECYGLMMRLEDDPEIPAMYKGENSMFSPIFLINNICNDFDLFSFLQSRLCSCAFIDSLKPDPRTDRAFVQSSVRIFFALAYFSRRFSAFP